MTLRTQALRLSYPQQAFLDGLTRDMWTKVFPTEKNTLTSLVKRGLVRCEIGPNGQLVAQIIDQDPNEFLTRAEAIGKANELTLKLEAQHRAVKRPNGRWMICNVSSKLVDMEGNLL